MIPFGSIKAPSSYGRIKSEIFHLGADCYQRSARSRKIFNALGSGIGQIALCFNPNYRRGEIREAIHRELELEEFKPRVIASDIKFNQPLEQKGIAEEMRHSLAWEFITRDISEGKTMFFAKNAMAGILAVFAWVAASPLFLIGSGLLIARSISDWARASRLRDAGFRYLISNPFSGIKFVHEYFSFKDAWPENLNARFIKHLARINTDLAAYMDGERMSN